MRLTRRWQTTPTTLLIVILFAAPLWACSVPVFRYALERWSTDDYEVVVFHRGELPTDLQKLADEFEPLSLDADPIANVAVVAVDLDAEPSEAMLELWESQQTETLPWMLVRYPEIVRHATAPTVWSGPAATDTFEALTDSPLRHEIARRLLKGATGVWVLLESGNTSQDDAAFEFLNQQLEYLEQTLALPEIDEQDVLDGLVSIDPAALEISFSAIRLSRDDPNEKMLVEMLLGSESDLRELDGPMAFPVFGRGRVLYALVGEGINDDTLHEACSTLVGPCTCQVKDQNPGLDLVTSIAWDSLIEPQVEIDKELPPLQGLGAFADAGDVSTGLPEDTLATADELPVTPPDSTKEQDSGAEPAPSPTEVTAESPGVTESAPPPTASPRLNDGMSAVLRNALIAVAVCLAGIVCFSLFLVSRKSS